MTATSSKPHGNLAHYTRRIMADYRDFGKSSVVCNQEISVSKARARLHNAASQANVKIETWVEVTPYMTQVVAQVKETTNV